MNIFYLPNSKFVDGIEILYFWFITKMACLKRERRCMMSWFSVNYANGEDILKIFACSESHQQADDFVVHWYVTEISKSLRIKGFQISHTQMKTILVRLQNGNPMCSKHQMICPWTLLLHLECKIS
jgi:hypothetical protein